MANFSFVFDHRSGDVGRDFFRADVCEHSYLSQTSLSLIKSRVASDSIPHLGVYWSEVHSGYLDTGAFCFHSNCFREAA